MIESIDADLGFIVRNLVSENYSARAERQIAEIVGAARISQFPTLLAVFLSGKKSGVPVSVYIPSERSWHVFEMEDMGVFKVQSAAA